MAILVGCSATGHVCCFAAAFLWTREKTEIRRGTSDITVSGKEERRGEERRGD